MNSSQILSPFSLILLKILLFTEDSQFFVIIFDNFFSSPYFSFKNVMLVSFFLKYFSILNIQKVIEEYKWCFLSAGLWMFIGAVGLFFW